MHFSNILSIVVTLLVSKFSKEIEVKLPTEREIALSKDYNKYIPQYMMKEDGEIINMNQNSVENIIEIKEENQKGNIENKFFYLIF